MSVTDWKVIYRAYGGEELAKEIEDLKKALKGGFVSQGSGSVNFTKDPAELRDRLNAATEVRREKNGTAPAQVAQADFSGTRIGDF